MAGTLGLTHVAISEVDREQIRQQQRARTDVEQQQQQMKRQKAAIRAAGILRDCKPGQAEYLVGKRLRWPSGLLNRTLIRGGEEAFPAGSLVVPLYNETGELVNVQLIRHDGVRHYLAGGQSRPPATGSRAVPWWRFARAMPPVYRCTWLPGRRFTAPWMRVTCWLSLRW